jgi:hypothetical protein
VSAAIASSIWLVLSAPTIGAATTGLRRSQASAICAWATPCSAATAPSVSTISLSVSALPVCLRIGFANSPS